ncbi:MAG: winged helix-turn-helix transcriptional regulator [Solirubrobacterales bacterium]|nr:winged helix-turn-helix transcriptional regulator [Solirubrobacterales bacterium]
MAAKKRKTAKKAKAPELVDRRLMKALSHPGRVRCLAILNERTASPNELSEELRNGLSQVSYHIKVLREYELIELVRTEPRRGAVEHYYSAVHRALVPDDTWKDLPSSTRRGISVGILQELFDDAAEAMEAEAFDNRDGFHVSWTPLVLDKKAWKGLSALLAETLDGVFDLQAEATERLATEGKGSKDGIAATVALVSFESARSPAEGRKAPATKHS